MFAKFRDGLERKASVIECKAIRKEDGTPSGKFRYYLHRVELNRRMDSWVHGDDVRYDAESDEVAKKERSAAATLALPASAGGESSANGRGKSAGRGGGKSGAGVAGAAGPNHGHALAEGDIIDADGTVFKTKRNVRKEGCHFVALSLVGRTLQPFVLCVVIGRR